MISKLDEQVLLTLGISIDGKPSSLMKNETYKKIKSDPISMMMFNVIKDLMYKCFHMGTIFNFFLTILTNK